MVHKYFWHIMEIKVQSWQRKNIYEFLHVRKKYNHIVKRFKKNHKKNPVILFHWMTNDFSWTKSVLGTNRKKLVLNSFFLSPLPCLSFNPCQVWWKQCHKKFPHTVLPSASNLNSDRNSQHLKGKNQFSLSAGSVPVHFLSGDEKKVCHLSGVAYVFICSWLGIQLKPSHSFNLGSHLESCYQIISSAV